MKSLLLRYALAPNTAAVAAQGEHQHIRVFVVLDKQSNLTDWGVSNAARVDAFATALISNRTNFNGVLNPLNLNYRERFRVLYDKFHTMSLESTIQNGTPSYFFRQKFIKLGSREVTYGANTGGTTQDINTNALIFFALAHDVNGATEFPVLHVSMRLRYTDS